ncbi:unnamed protein product [Chrysoparadoxa australica]
MDGERLPSASSSSQDGPSPTVDEWEKFAASAGWSLSHLRDGSAREKRIMEGFLTHPVMQALASVQGDIQQLRASPSACGSRSGRVMKRDSLAKEQHTSYRSRLKRNHLVMDLVIRPHMSYHLATAPLLPPEIVSPKKAKMKRTKQKPAAKQGAMRPQAHHAVEVAEGAAMLSLLSQGSGASAGEERDIALEAQLLLNMGSGATPQKKAPQQHRRINERSV